MVATGCGQDLMSQEDFAYETKAQLAAGPVAIDAGADTLLDTGDLPTDVGNVTPDAGPECETEFDCLDIKGKTPCRQPSCDSGVCALKQLEAGAPCTHPLATLKECEQTSCNADGQCAIGPLPDAEPCGFGSCGKLCKSGVCQIAGPEDYDDGNACTKDYCKQGSEVVHENLTDLSLDCDDGNACTESEYCAGGACVGTPLNCADGFACTADACDPAKGCVNTGDAAKCDDDDPCTKEACDLAVGCTVDGANDGATCDDSNDCTDKDACDAEGSCAGEAFCKCDKEADCVSNNLCLLLICAEGLCQEDLSQTVVCDQAADTSCAKNICDPVKGACAMQPIAEGVVCDDGDACTKDSTCVGGACMGTGTTTCDDNNACTIDSCDADVGCQYDATADVCNDNNKCTADDACINGACVGVAKSCDDEVACTKDSCDSGTGECAHAAADEPCDDDNACTKDVCHVTKGCEHQEDAGATCDDGDACTKDACQGGQCVVADYLCQCKTAADCNDKNPCTKNVCDGGKCSHSDMADGASCSTADKCAVADSGVCKGGFCTGGTLVDCNAGLPTGHL